MSFPLLLDEMFSDTIAQQLRAKGHNVQAVVADPSLGSLPDDQILARATAAGRALVDHRSGSRDLQFSTLHRSLGIVEYASLGRMVRTAFRRRILGPPRSNHEQC